MSKGNHIDRFICDQGVAQRTAEFLLELGATGVRDYTMLVPGTHDIKIKLLVEELPNGRAALSVFWFDNIRDIDEGGSARLAGVLRNKIVSEGGISAEKQS